MFPMIVWHAHATDVVRSALTSLSRIRLIEEWVVSADIREGFCVACEKFTPMTVFGGAMLGEYINLREGMVCQVCGLNARSRLLLHAVRLLFQSESAELATLEAFSPFARAVKQRWTATRLSEYFGANLAAGTVMQRPAFQGGRGSAPHQDLMSLGYGTETLDGIIHNDVLEHVPDVTIAVREMFRVLRPGGRALFTMPWFPWLTQTKVRGRIRTDGTLEQLLPAEYHGDGMREGGIYTFYNFGADLGKLIVDAGFEPIQYGVCYCPTSGFLSNNDRYSLEGLMLPTVLTATKPL